MNTEPITNLCPKCGGTIPGDAPQGLCPRCVLAGAARPTDNGLKPGERLTAPPLETVAAAFPQLEIIELIGLGGMGVVYKARQPKLDRFVALKLLPASLSADPAFAERFHREARFLARLNHPNIVTVFDFGQSGGFCFLLLEFVDGVNLRQAMQAGRFSPAEALAIVPSICGALQYAHDQGVLHRDIKPENILLDARGTVKLADFGIAKLVCEPGDTRADVTLTQSGARLGTPHYMAPEQIEKPSEVDHRADIYSLGVVFYELLTGELPLGRFAPPSEKADLDARVDAIVFRALAKERELRQQSAGEVKTEVEGLGTRATTSPPTIIPQPAMTSAEPPLDQAPNPWPHRLFWLVLGLILLPAAAGIATMLIPVLLRSGKGHSASQLVGLVPMTVGALLVWGFFRTRPTSAPAQPGAEWNPWPKRIFYTVLLTVVTPVLLLVVGLVVPRVLATRKPLRLAPSAVPPNLDAVHAAADRPVQLIRTERTATDSHVRLRWELRSPVPAEVMLASGEHSKVIPLMRDNGSNYVTMVSVLFERQRQGNEVRLTVQGGDATEGGIFFINLRGNPDQILAKANELVAGDLPLKFNTPIWIAFAGLEQVRLEVSPAAPAATPNPLKLVSPEVGGLPQALPTNAPSAAALKWHFAWQQLEENRKKAEVGVVAPGGPEVLAAERDLVEAEAEFIGQPSLAAQARQSYTERWFDIVQRMMEVGKASRTEVNQAELQMAQAKEGMTGLFPAAEPGTAYREDLAAVFRSARRGNLGYSLALLGPSLRSAGAKPGDRWVFRLGDSAYEFKGDLTLRLTTLKALFAARAGDVVRLREAQTAGASLWPTNGEVAFCEVWVDHFAPGRADQDTDEVRVPASLLRGLQPGQDPQVTVIHRFKEFGKPTTTNVVTGDWLKTR
jgi:serine/threonine protein kinase